jgi:hypothetical protein
MPRVNGGSWPAPEVRQLTEFDLDPVKTRRTYIRAALAPAPSRPTCEKGWEGRESMDVDFFARSSGKPYSLTMLTPGKRPAGGFHFIRPTAKEK